MKLKEWRIWRMSESEIKLMEMRGKFSVFERVWYRVKRYWIFALIILLSYFVSGEGYMEALLLKQAAKASMGLLLSFVFFQLALPKSGLQTEIFEKRNFAAGLVVAGIILGVCLA